MSKAESANLILKLYDLRREKKMRKAREWFTSFFPDSADEILETVNNPETSAYYRMVTTYWDMACSLVLHEAIEAEMFRDTTGEYFSVFAKVQPFVGEIREKWNNMNYLKNLEEFVMTTPDAEEKLAARRDMLKQYIAARAGFSKVKE